MAAVTEERASETRKLKNKAKASLALLLIAVISISTATYAWFTLSNSTSVQSMIVEVSTGVTLKAYAGVPGTADSKDPSKYSSVIMSEGSTSKKPGDIITDALPFGLPGGVVIDSLSDVKLFPVTSGNGVKLYTQGINESSAASSGIGPERMYYLELTLTFLSDTNMDVYLNGDPSATGAEDGTNVAPNTINEQADEDAVKALRISFEDTTLNTSIIYEPDNFVKGSTTTTANTTLHGKALADSIGAGTDQSTFTNLGNNTGRNKGTGNESPAIFSLKKGEPKTIVMRMWVEGEDAECVNNNTTNIEKAKMNLRLRFSGADTNGNFIETPVA